MNFRNISAWSIRNPTFAIVLFVGLMLAGMVSFARMDVNNNPDISFPAVNVVVAQPGAAPTELETQVTRRIEAAVRGVNGVEEMSSYIAEGNSRTFVQFDIGTPVDRALNDVRNAVTQIRSQLPQGILEPQVERVDIDGGPLAYVSVEATNMTLQQLSWFVDDTIAKRLLAIPGMAQVERGGGVDREIRVILDPARLQAQGVTASAVNAQLVGLNLNAAGGRAEIAGAEQSVRVLGNAQDAYALSQMRIVMGGGRTIKLADVADVQDLYGEQRSLARMNGRQVVSFSIAKAKGASDVTVYDAAMTVLKQVEKENPQIHLTRLFSTVDYTKLQYHSAIDAMVEGAVLAVIVVFLFLRDWRAMMISAIAIPLSAIPAFWFMNLMGLSLNGISLLALSLVAGVLVDDAIVEIENIVRHMRMGKSPYQASIDAADEIGLAVVATTMAIVAVFLPVGLMPGISGQFFKSFGLTVVLSVLLSLAVARLITPMVAAYFLRPHLKREHHGGPILDAYVGLLRWSLVNRWKTVGLGALAFVAMIGAFMALPFTFSPPQNVDYSQINVAMPPGTTLAQTTAVADRAAAVVRASPIVSAAFEDISTGSAQLFLTLDPKRTESSTEFERTFQPKLAAMADARVSFQSQTSGGGRDVTVMLAGEDPIKLEAAATALVGQMAKLPTLRAPRIDGQLNRPEIVIRPRFDLAADLGVSTAAISEAIRIATLGDIDQNVAKFSLSDRQIPIRVMLREASRQNLTTIENLPVPTVSGGSVPLKVIAQVSFGSGPAELRRYAQKRRVLIGADLAPGAVSGTAMKQIHALPAMTSLPSGVEEAKFGDSKWQDELVNNFIVAVISGVLLVFAVLVLLYKRIMPPLVNMGSLLIAPLGSALALLATHQAISLPVLIGLLMLLGIVAKNSILLVDFAVEQIAHGVPRAEAILDAGAKRAQPIVMTTVAMVAGMVPIALSLGGDGSFRKPMAITVIGGLVLSTVLTLVIVPAAFSLADEIERKLGRFFGSRLLNQRPADPLAGAPPGVPGSVAVPAE